MKHILTGIAAAALIANSAMAGSVALVGFTNGSPTVTGVDGEVGWQFSLSKSVTVTALGIFDYQSAPLNQAHTVGIFRNSDEALIGSETIPAGSSGFTEDGFEFVNLSTEFDLPAGSYTIEETVLEVDQDSYRTLTTSVTTDPDVTYINSARTYTPGFGYPTSFGDPTKLGGLQGGNFGPNFIFTEDAAAAPEPATGVLVAGAAILLFALRAAAARR